jgi:thymidylate synthase (FAD)
MKVVLLAYTQLNPDTGSLPAPLRETLQQQEGRATSASPERLVEYAGRVCYRSEDRMGRGQRFISARVGEGHESIIEHLSFTFLIEGISRACSHQLVRHRLASYSQESQRYCEMQPEDELVMPPAVESDPASTRLWKETVEGLRAAYQSLRESGVRKEDARFLLPNAMATRIVVTMNARSLRHFLKVRLPRNAQWEIRALASEMLGAVTPVAPSIFGDLRDEYTDESALRG